MFKIQENRSGFTMIELLVAIAIIGLLSTIILISVDNARANGRDAFRKLSMKQVESALEIYKHKNGSYPSTGPLHPCWGESDMGGNRSVSGVNAYIPNLTPSYILELPRDPKFVTTGWSGFSYCSDGTNYKLILQNSGPESFPSVGQGFYDPARPGAAWMICSDEPACSTW